MRKLFLILSIALLTSCGEYYPWATELYSPTEYYTPYYDGIRFIKYTHPGGEVVFLIDVVTIGERPYYDPPVLSITLQNGTVIYKPYAAVIVEGRILYKSIAALTHHEVDLLLQSMIVSSNVYMHDRYIGFQASYNLIQELRILTK